MYLNKTSLTHHEIVTVSHTDKRFRQVGTTIVPLFVSFHVAQWPGALPENLPAARPQKNLGDRRWGFLYKRNCGGLSARRAFFDSAQFLFSC